MGVQGYHTRTNTLFSSILSQKTNNSSVPDVSSIKNSNCCRGRKLKRYFWVKDHFHVLSFLNPSIAFSSPRIKRTSRFVILSPELRRIEVCFPFVIFLFIPKSYLSK